MSERATALFVLGIVAGASAMFLTLFVLIRTPAGYAAFVDRCYEIIEVIERRQPEEHRL